VKTSDPTKCKLILQLATLTLSVANSTCPLADTDPGHCYLRVDHAAVAVMRATELRPEEPVLSVQEVLTDGYIAQPCISPSACETAALPPVFVHENHKLQRTIKVMSVLMFHLPNQRIVVIRSIYL
jgi:hypothetical protein